MKNVLTINTSLSGEQSKSNQLVQQFVTKWKSNDDISVVSRDLNSDNLPHLSGEEMQAWMTQDDQRTPEQRALANISDSYVEEIQQADTIIVGMPMYNFGVPSVFKAWIDRIARAGMTFRYTENGPQGLLEGKKVYVLATRGGIYAGTPKDTQTQYIKDVFAFVGITDVEFIYAEGLAMAEPPVSNNLSQAEEKIVELISKQAA